VSSDDVWVMRPTVPCAASRRLVDAAVAAAVASFAARPGMALIAGGLPLLADGQVAGAIGVAGAMTGADDRRIAEAAIAAVATT
jgi:uncharacterized protein GlcG (DUF336 family)